MPLFGMDVKIHQVCGVAELALAVSEDFVFINDWLAVKDIVVCEIRDESYIAFPDVEFTAGFGGLHSIVAATENKNCVFTNQSSSHPLLGLPV